MFHSANDKQQEIQTEEIDYGFYQKRHQNDREIGKIKNSNTKLHK